MPKPRRPSANTRKARPMFEFIGRLVDWLLKGGEKKRADDETAREIPLIDVERERRQAAREAARRARDEVRRKGWD
jgi:hypothetical protein